MHHLFAVFRNCSVGFVKLFC